MTGDYALTGWGESVKLSADAVGLVTPTDLNPIATAVASPGVTPGAHWTAALRAVEEGKGRFGDINTVFLGYVTLALALLGGWTGRRRLKPWIWTAIVFGVLALGPLLQISGRFRFSLDNMLPEGVTFPLPFTLLHFIPFINGNRVPNRNSVILMLALAVLAGYGAAWLLGRVAEGRRSRGAEGRSRGEGSGAAEQPRGGDEQTHTLPYSHTPTHRFPVFLITASAGRRYPRRALRRPAADDRRDRPAGLPADRGRAGRLRDHAVAAGLAQQLRRAGQ